MACLMKFGSLPPAKNSDDPTPRERRAIEEQVAAYQHIFDTH
jgi:L-asparaginase